MHFIYCSFCREVREADRNAGAHRCTECGKLIYFDPNGRYFGDEMVALSNTLLRNPDRMFFCALHGPSSHAALFNGQARCTQRWAGALCGNPVDISLPSPKAVKPSFAQATAPQYRHPGIPDDESPEDEQERQSKIFYSSNHWNN